MQQFYKIACFFLICCFISYQIGYINGVGNTLDWAADTAIKYMDIDMSKIELLFYLQNYRHKLNETEVLKNALIRNDTRNQT